ACCSAWRTCGSVLRSARATATRVRRSSRFIRRRAWPRALRACMPSSLSCFCTARHCRSRGFMRTSGVLDCPRYVGLCRYNDTMSEAIVVNHAVRVPGRALSLRAVRASGPGGQNVNKVATKVDLRVDLEAIEGLRDAARLGLQTLARHRLDADGRLVITRQVSRNQARNVEDARHKVRALVAAALVRPRARVATRTPPHAQERRLDVKR